MIVMSCGALVRLAAFNLITCAVVGPLLGTTIWALLAGSAIGPLTRDFAGGWLLVYALIAFGPFAVLAAIVATVLCVWLLRTRMAQWNVGRWLLAGGGSGFLLGSVCPLMLLLAGWGDDGDAVTWALAYSVLGGVIGAVCGVMIAAYCWRAARGTLSAAATST
jgi:hypothetical protein